MNEPQLIAAFLVGLLGGVHCVGMCGGIVGALTMTLPEAYRREPLRMWPLLLAYNLGRLLSYGAAGALMGGIGYVAGHLAGMQSAQLALTLFAGAFMIALGLYLGGWWFGLGRLERAGGHLWRRLEPLGRGLLPISRVWQALALGALWGWLPCGLVYSVLVWALGAGSATAGGLLMLSFGLGTLPVMLALGAVAARLSALVRLPWVRKGVGASIVLFGLFQVWRAW